VEHGLAPGPDPLGALFSRLLGFSFAVLRLSTLVLAWAGLLALYGTLRELGTHPLLAGLGTLMLWLNPVFFVLSHSFMTSAGAASSGKPETTPDPGAEAEGGGTRRGSRHGGRWLPTSARILHDHHT
jgi:hypothetical protein